MLRRRRMVYSSSSDDDGGDDDEQQQQRQQQQQQFQHDENNDVVFEDAVIEQEEDEDELDEEIEISSDEPIPSISAVTLNSTTTTAVAAVELSDDDFIDVADNLSSPSPPPPPPPQISSPPVTSIATAPFVASDCAVNDQLRKLGVCLRREWLDSCQLGLQNSVPGFGNFDVDTKAKLCFGQLLLADMNFVGAGVLPENVCGLHQVDLAGPFVLQVDEVINISCPLRERYKNAAPGLKRCLKLSMTDGVQRIFGMEYRPIKSLAPLSSAGFKVIIRNVHVRRGLLMLVPEVLEVLGGSVEELEAARQRLVEEVNKPPRGKRTRSGTVTPISNRATRAAWPQNGVTDQSVRPNVPDPVSRNTTDSVVHGFSQLRETIQGINTLNRTRQVTPRETTELFGMGGTNQQSISTESGQGSIRSGSDQYSINKESAQQSISTEAVQHPAVRETASLSSVIEAHEPPVGREATDPLPSGESLVHNSFSTTVMEDEHVIADYMDHPFMLSGEKEFPFTYMASLLTKWEAVQDKEPFVRGKVKCFMTAVKGFQFKNRSTFALWGFIDDGSLVTEVFIHHNVVQSVIGYSPQEVTATLTSSDTEAVESMKSTLKQFQIFLSTFEGTMLVEVTKTSNIPVVLEMTQGCIDVNAWQLLQRVKPPTSSSLRENDNSNIISLSP